MKRRARTWLGAAALVLAPGIAAAVSLHGRTSTVFQWWEQASDGDAVAPLTQYLSFTAADLVSGQDLTLRGYGQLTKDLASDDPLRGKVFYLYADWNDAWKDRLDLRAGRQFAQNAAGSVVVDGVDVDLHALGPVGIRAFGGGDVQYEDEYEPGDLTAGLSLYLNGYEGTQVEIATFLKYDESDLARAMVGASASQDLSTWGRAYGDLQYDTLGDAVSEILLGVRLTPKVGWIVTAEYFESLPVFDSTSIYSVFAVDKYYEGRAKLSYDLTDKVRFYGGYARIWYEDDDNANDYVLGTRLLDLYGCRLELEYQRRQGYGGDLDGYRAVVGRDFLSERLSTEVGGEYVPFQREEEDDEDTTGSYWAEAQYRWTKALASSARAENIIDAGGENHVEGLLRLDWNF